MITLTRTPVLGGIWDDLKAKWDQATGQQPQTSAPVSMTAVMMTPPSGSGSMQQMSTGSGAAPAGTPPVPQHWYKNYWIWGGVGIGVLAVTGGAIAFWPAKKSTSVSGYGRRKHR